MISADVHFTKGHSHIINEDYGLVQVDDTNQFMVVADGCSTGYYSDIAARVMAHACKNSLIFHNQKNVFPDYDTLAFDIVSSSVAAAKVMGLGDLLSTLIVTFVKDDQVYTYFYGDGYIVIKWKNKEFPVITKVDFIGNAPNYLWYRTNPARFTIAGCEMQINGDIFPRDYPVRFQALVDQLEYVGIFTDGVASFIANKPVEGSRFGTKITAEMAISELTNLKSTTGNFVIRRMNRFLKEAQADGFLHDDDITSAVMSFGERS